MSWIIVFHLGEVIKDALRDSVENYFLDFDARSKKQGMKDADSQNVPAREVKTELLHSISDTKALFSEAMKSLDLFENYIQRPSEKTAKRLKLSLDRRKVPEREKHSQDKLNELVDIFRIYLNKKRSDSFDYEHEKHNNSELKITNCSNKNLDYDLAVESQPRSISPVGNQFDIASNHDNNENEFKNKNINENERNDEKMSITDIQKNEGNDKPKLNFDEVKQQLKKIESSLPMNSKIRKNDKYNMSHEYKVNKGLKVEVSSFAIAGEDVQKNRGYSYEETHERNMKGKPPKPRNEFMESVEKKSLKDENNFLKEKLKLLEIKYKELLADFGECSVREMAKEKEGRKSELLLQMNLCNQPEDKQSSANLRDKSPSNEQDGIKEDKELVHRAASTSDDNPQLNPSMACSIVTGNKLVQRTGQQLQRDGGEKVKLPGDKDKDGALTSGAEINVNCVVKETPAVQALQSSSKEKTSSGEELNQSGTGVNGASVIVSTGRDGNNTDSLIEQSYDTLPYSVQQDYSNTPEYITLNHVPSASVAASLYNNYMFLLLSLAQNLLSSDVVKLKVWAAQRFSIDNPQNATDVLFQLDQKGFIHASDLSQLRDFFESILRIDLVCVVDAFLLGDYSLFREISASKKLDVNRSHTQQNTVNSRYHNILSSVLNPSGSSFQSLPNAGSNSPRNGERSLPTTTRSQSKNASKLPVTHQAAAPNSWNTSKPMLLARSPDENETLKNGEQNLRTSGAGPPARVTDTVVSDSSFSSERRTGTSNSTTRTNLQTNKTRNGAIFSTNGSKLSKFQRPDSVLNVQSSGTSPNTVTYQDDNWLCTHYKRHSYVKFECCDKFWPCHRCHNNQSSCGRRKLKSRDTKMLKCVYCDKVQQFGHFCCECGAKFADYYCGLCKHLTGRDDHPYHCEKCGICRIHGDRSFHCDVCGVCLDVQLRGNHKCRAGSAHDECCICLEDAFTGCQILPCSHKVHKECATQMIRSGITRCPICRESFAHKLERRPADAGRRSDFGK